jgi:hypothetical protein
MAAASRDSGRSSRSGRSSPSGTEGRLVYQPGYSRLLFGIFVAFALWWVIDEALGDHPARAVVTGLWLVAVTTALACLFWRPAVVVDDAGVELRNLVRDVRVPWPALEELDTRYTLTLHSGGRRYQSWAGAAPGRPSLGSWLLSGRGAGAGAGWGAGGSAVSGRYDHALPDPRWTAGGGSSAPASSRDLRADSGATAFMIEQRWHAWRERMGATAGVDPGQPVVVRWRPGLPAVSGAAAVLALLLGLVIT